MAKINISRVTDMTRVLATEVGKQIPDLIQFVADLGENSLRALRQGLSFADNFKAIDTIVTLQHNTVSTVDNQGKTVTGVIPTGIISTDYGIDSFSWWISNTSTLQVVIKYAANPGVTLDTSVKLNVKLVLLLA